MLHQLLYEDLPADSTESLTEVSVDNIHCFSTKSVILLQMVIKVIKHDFLLVNLC